MSSAQHPSSPANSGAPVLFLVFNRPEATAQVFAAIRAARPSRLYIAADGPRPGRPDDSHNCAQTREIALAVDWPCQVHTLLRESNLGCKHAIEEGLDWFFAAEEEGIVLEDDCLPTASFFPFCADLLQRFRQEPRVFSRSGSNFQDGQRRGEASYYFSKHFHCWGWASWRRAWSAYRAGAEPSDVELANGLKHFADGSILFPPYWLQIRRLCREQVIDSWAYHVSLSCMARGGTLAECLHVIPQRNLVANLGFGRGATNTKEHAANPAAASAPIDFPLHHPGRMQRDALADRHTDRVHFGIAWLPYLRRQVALNFPLLDKVWKRRSIGHS